MSPLKTVLDIKGLSVGLASDPEQRILDDISFELKSGKVIGLIGEAGSGKTVLARAIVNGMAEPLAYRGGQVIYGGQDLLSMSAQSLGKIRGNKIGYIGSNPAGSLDPTLPVGDQIVEKLRSVDPSLSRKAATERVLDVLAAVRIPSSEVRFHEYPFQFSGGMMQRVMIVDALVTNPTVLIADNITHALDVTVAAQIIRLIRELRDRFSTAILFISSSLPVAELISDEILVLQKGKIVERATPQALISTPQHGYTKSLLARLPRIWGDDIVAPEAIDAPTLMQVNGVYRTYHVRKKGTLRSMNAVQAVRGVSLDIREGENIGIVGESGCGKSTFAKVLMGLETATEGKILLYDQDIQDTPIEKRNTDTVSNVQMVFQNPFDTLNPSMTVGRQVIRALEIFRQGKNDAGRRARMLELLDLVKLPREFADRMPRQLSGGQKQRVGIARAFAGGAHIVVADEPVSALDVSVQAAVTDLLMDIQRENHTTLLFISHDLAIVRYLSDRVMVMYLGHVVELGTTDQVFSPPYHPYTEALLSAVPIADTRVQKRRVVLEGDIPSAMNPPPGCPFQTRCRWKDQVPGGLCDTVLPDIRDLAPGHQVKCHLSDAVLAKMEPVFSQVV
ncbi:MAG: ABC transporter ATP-binding protein [Pseudorhodobacter sp.]|nr:ABC transporter ATP-binding protein [Pseudorhodobacter sp.]